MTRILIAAAVALGLALPAAAQTDLVDYPDATPVLTDKVWGVDDPAGTWSAKLFEFGAIRDLFQDNLTGLQVDSGTLTADDPWLFEQTWNEGATTFTGLRMNVTNTASASDSKLLDFQVDGDLRFSVDKLGRMTLGSSGAADAVIEAQQSAKNAILLASMYRFQHSSGASGTFDILNSNAKINLGGAWLNRDADGTLAQRNGTSAQEFRWWNTFTSLSDGEYGYASWKETANVFEIGTKNAGGTGVDRNMALAPAGGTTSIVGFLATPDTGELTIATGAVTATGSYHTVDTEGDAASDDLDTINGCTDGHQLIIQAEHTDRTVVAKDGTGNLRLAGDFSLDSTDDTLTLLCAGALSAWVETARSDNGI